MAKRHSTDLARSTSHLPARVLADRVISKLREAEKALQFCTTVHQAKLVSDVAAAQEVFAHRQRLGEECIGYAHQVKINALSRLADLLSEMPKSVGAKGNPGGQGARVVRGTSPPTQTYAELGIDKDTAKMARLLKALPDPVRQAIETREVKLSDVRRTMKRDKVRQNLEEVAARESTQPTGKYDVIVIDPPWPMVKIDRDEFPEQTGFNYPTMTEQELSALAVPVADDCHVWLWTTHKFLPMAFRLLDAWALKYVCAFVWHKPGGFQPFDLPQYNCEFALYARKGSPQFLDTKQFPVCFDAPRTGHSEKPEQFYETVRRVTAGRRLDMFNRRQIEGFDGWGKEAA